MARYRRKRRKLLRGGNQPSFAEGGNKSPPNTQFEHNEPPSAQEAVRQQQAGAQNDAEMQMAMNQTGGNKDQEGGELTVPQSGAASPEGNDAMANSAGMLMQSRQNAPSGGEKTSVKGGARRKTRRKRRKKKTKKKKKKKKKRKRKTKRKLKNKYKFARKYHQKGCSRKKC